MNSDSNVVWASVVAAIALVLASGCSSSRSLDWHDSVELVTTEWPNVHVRMLLLADGAAKIELKMAFEEPGRLPAYVVVLPVHPKQTQRLIDAISAMADLPVKPLRTGWPEKDRTTIRCRRNGRDRFVGVDEYQLRVDGLWRGVVEEIQTLGQLNLAIALYEYKLAELHWAEGSGNAAFDGLERAAQAFGKWESIMSRRYGGGGWEPGVQPREYLVDGKRFTISGEPAGPAFLVKAAQMPRELAMELTRRYWQDYMKYDLSSREVNGAAVVSYSPDFVQSKSSAMPSEVPPALIRELLQQEAR